VDRKIQQLSLKRAPSVVQPCAGEAQGGGGVGVAPAGVAEVVGFEAAVAGDGHAAGLGQTLIDGQHLQICISNFTTPHLGHAYTHLLRLGVVVMSIPIGQGGWNGMEGEEQGGGGL